MLCWFYRATQILCKFCQVRLVRRPQHHLMVHVMSAVQQAAVVVEEGFMAVNEEAPSGIKQEEIPEDIFFPDIKTEPNEVSYVCVCVCVCYETYFTIVRKCHFVF